MTCFNVFNKPIKPNTKAIFEKNRIWKKGEKNEISITFGNYPCKECSANAGWSLIGNEAMDEPYPSMNLGFIDPPFDDFEWNGNIYLKSGFEYEKRNLCRQYSSSIRDCEANWVAGWSVIHEFGHALGMKHEHQNNLDSSNPLDMNVEYIIKYMNDNYDWDRKKTMDNITTLLSDPNYYNGSKFDPYSIMLYNFPQSWLNSGKSLPPNFTLSTKDKEWLEKMYPKDDPIDLTVYFIDNNYPEWKRAWVEKTVTENISPYVGINFIFKTSKPLAPGETYPPPTAEPLTSLSTLNIFIIMAFSFMLISILAYYVK